MKMLSQGEYWSKEAENFDAIYSHKKSRFSVFMDKLLRKAMYNRFTYTLEQSEPIDVKTFLDVGCGTGLYSLELARRGAKKVVGIDVAQRMIKICKKRAKDEKLYRSTEFVQHNIEDFRYNQRFNITIGMGLLDYIKNPGPALGRMRKYTTDRVMLSFPVLWSWRTVPRIIRLRLRHCPVYFYTKKQIRWLMSQAGFVKVFIKQMGPMYFVIGS